MNLLSWDRAWQRSCKDNPQFAGKSQSGFRWMTVVSQLSAASGALSNSQPVNFGSLAVILGFGAGLSTSAAATAAIRDLSGARISMDYQGAGGAIISGGRVNLAAILGNSGTRLWPGCEIIMPTNTALNVALENLTTSTINVDLAFHCMVERLN